MCKPCPEGSFRPSDLREAASRKQQTAGDWCSGPAATWVHQVISLHQRAPRRDVSLSSLTSTGRTHTHTYAHARAHARTHTHTHTHTQMRQSSACPQCRDRGTTRPVWTGQATHQVSVEIKGGGGQGGESGYTTAQRDRHVALISDGGGGPNNFSGGFGALLLQVLVVSSKQEPFKQAGNLLRPAAQFSSRTEGRWSLPET